MTVVVEIRRLSVQDYLPQPEPEVAVVRPKELDYEDHHPTPEEIYLLIEVSDRTLKRNREPIAPLE